MSQAAIDGITHLQNRTRVAWKNLAKHESLLIRHLRQEHGMSYRAIAERMDLRYGVVREECRVWEVTDE